VEFNNIVDITRMMPFCDASAKLMSATHISDMHLLMKS